MTTGHSSQEAAEEVARQAYRAEAEWPGGGAGRRFDSEAEARAWIERKARVHPEASFAIEPVKGDEVEFADPLEALRRVGAL